MANAATKLGRVKVLQVSLETEKGTLVAGATHVLAFEPVMQLTDSTQSREPSGAALGHFPAVSGERVGTCTFRTELRAVSGAATAAIDAGLAILLQACGFGLTAGPPNVFAPVSSVAAMKTITIGMHEGGGDNPNSMYKQLHGCMGNVRISGEFGKPVFFEFDFSGVWNPPTTVAVPTATINTQLPIRAAAVTFTIGSYNPLISTFNLDMGNKITPVEDIQKAQGVTFYVITGRDPVITMDALAELIAYYDAYGLWLVGTEAALSMAFTNGTRGLTLAAPKLQHRAPQEGDRDGKLTEEITAQLNVSDHDTGNDELTLTAT